MLKKLIRKKLQNYRINLNEPDLSLPEKLSQPKSVAVIGGGIAGISAACNLAERGFSVHLFEKENFLGGKVGSWEFESNGETLRTEHGFHGFFRQYLNLRNFLKKIGAHKHLIPIDDYTILFDKNKKQGFKGLDNTPLINVLELRKFGIVDWKTFINPLGLPFINLLNFNFATTYKKFDSESFASFAKRTHMNDKMRLVFNSFSRAFFAEPEDMSMAELIKSFHFYFLSNEGGLLYDVLDSDFQNSFITYAEDFLSRHAAQIHYSTPVTELSKKERGFAVNGMDFDYCVLCTDVKHTKRLTAQSTGFEKYNRTFSQLTSLKQSGRYAVLRLWTDRFEADKTLPFFIFTDRLKCLDSVTLYHKMEKESARWSEENKGGIFELHSYAVPKDILSDEEVKEHLMQELYHYFPELNGMKITHEFFQHRDDFPGFHTNQYANRPEIKTEVPGFYVAGDWVKMNNCTMLMEAAYTSGSIAANYIMEQEGLRENQLISVSLKGILA
ncbi:MAG: FAD-dependent oxidoreductase [Bacteroidetes bacterium]|nr:FAD-dependent oxidoreductase [Bacteroidota bacterium]